MIRSLLVVAKRPAAGQTKTRLCPPLTAEAAAALYECFLYDKLDIMRAVPGAMCGIGPGFDLPGIRRNHAARECCGQRRAFLAGLLPALGADVYHRHRHSAALLYRAVCYHRLPTHRSLIFLTDGFLMRYST
jgi:hypothetical protein